MKWKRATWPGICHTCDLAVRPGQQVGRWGGQWQHRACVESQREVGRILDGLTFKGTAPRYQRKRKRT